MRAGARVAFYKRYNQVVHFLEQQQSFRVLFFRVVIVDVLRLVFKVCTGSIEFLLDEISKDDAVFDAIVLPSELIPKQFTLDLYAFYQFDLQKTSNWVLSASDSIDRQTVAQLVKGLLSEDENSWTIPSKQVLLPNRLRYKITPEEYESCGDNTDNCRRTVILSLAMENLFKYVIKLNQAEVQNQKQQDTIKIVIIEFGAPMTLLLLNGSLLNSRKIMLASLGILFNDRVCKRTIKNQ
eukprot:TRINITY_DN5162_c0_g1_i10.p2 TRINITY_DN5162_c0_g1~~TRINITY_DN5162_c0_g1_i10.p2  ORF type:complete len:238 (+),score=16.63 TRINITY_DN5162_c0_g1_i10:2-715(+)